MLASSFRLLGAFSDFPTTETFWDFSIELLFFPLSLLLNWESVPLHFFSPLKGFLSSCVRAQSTFFSSPRFPSFLNWLRVSFFFFANWRNKAFQQSLPRPEYLPRDGRTLEHSFFRFLIFLPPCEGQRGCASFFFPPRSCSAANRFFILTPWKRRFVYPFLSA